MPTKCWLSTVIPTAATADLVGTTDYLHHKTICKKTLLKNKGSIHFLFWFSNFKKSFTLCYKIDTILFWADQCYSSWASWHNVPPMFIKRVYTCLSHSLIVTTWDNQTTVWRELCLMNAPGCCGHSNRTGTFCDSLSTPGYHGNRKTERTAIIRYTISGIYTAVYTSNYIKIHILIWLRWSTFRYVTRPFLVYLHIPIFNQWTKFGWFSQLLSLVGYSIWPDHIA